MPNSFCGWRSSYNGNKNNILVDSKGTRKPIATMASKDRINVMGALDLVPMSLHLTIHEIIDSKEMDQRFTHIKSLYP